MSQSIHDEATEVLQDVCSDDTTLELTKEVCKKESVVMDQFGNLLPASRIDGDTTLLRLRKHLVLGTSTRWDQHDLAEANDIIESVPSDLTTESEIVSFINDKLQ